jgi:hypothetical protein
MTEVSVVPKRHRDPGIKQTSQEVQESPGGTNVSYSKENERAHSEIDDLAGVQTLETPPLPWWSKQGYPQSRNATQQQETLPQYEREQGTQINMMKSNHRSTNTTNTNRTDDGQIIQCTAANTRHNNSSGTPIIATPSNTQDLETTPESKETVQQCKKHMEEREKRQHEQHMKYMDEMAKQEAKQHVRLTHGGDDKTT